MGSRSGGSIGLVGRALVISAALVGLGAGCADGQNSEAQPDLEESNGQVKSIVACGSASLDVGDVVFDPETGELSVPGAETSFTYDGSTVQAQTQSDQATLVSAGADPPSIDALNSGNSVDITSRPGGTTYLSMPGKFSSSNVPSEFPRSLGKFQVIQGSDPGDLSVTTWAKSPVDQGSIHLDANANRPSVVVSTEGSSAEITATEEVRPVGQSANLPASVRAGRSETILDSGTEVVVQSVASPGTDTTCIGAVARALGD